MATKSLAQVSSEFNSSDYFEADDPDFLEALQYTVLPGDISVTSQILDEAQGAQAPPCTQPSLKRPFHADEDPIESSSHDGSIDSDSYAPSKFGEKMRRKRAKLQVQNSQLGGTEELSIFQGLAIYINGCTVPSVQDLRQLIVRHGGIFHAYLTEKSLVTHIITPSLTPAIREFKNVEVVKPEWIVDSANAGALLPWKNYMLRLDDGAEGSQGTQITPQSIFDGSTPQAQAFIGHSDNINSSPPFIDNNDTAEGTNTVEESDRQGSTSPSTPEPNKQTSLRPSPSAKQAMKPRPLYMTDPANAKEAVQVPGYAAHVSNPNAERAMANPEWRSAHTSIAPNFVDEFYKNSRLHHLSTWKAALKNLVMEAHERAENGDTPAVLDEDGKVVTKIPAETVGEKINDKGVSMRGAELVMTSASKWKAKAEDDRDEDRCIMHCDFDCFFVAAGLVSRPHLRGKPVVVCHSQGVQSGGVSTSEISSSSYEARGFGIKNGMSLQQARKLCPAVITIPYEFERYKKLALMFYTILMSHADDLEAVSVDEALIDVTSSVARRMSEADPAKELAESIRAEVKKSTGCEVSIGISHNIQLARLATRRAKPAGSYHLIPAAVPDFLAPLDIDHLHGFGRSIRQKAADKLGATTLGELVKKSKGSLCDALGKSTGERLYKALRGVDDRKLQSDKPRKSVSCEINYGIRFENNDQAEKFMYQMAEEVSRRLNDVYMLGRSITLKIMKRDPTAPVEPPKFLGHGCCDLFNKQMPLAGPGGRATSDDRVIGEHAWRLLKSFYFDPKELRGIGIQIQKLESASATATELEQSKLPFKRLESPKKSQKARDGVRVVVRPPTQEGNTGIDEQPAAGSSRNSAALELPSFSQVDKEIFDALPEDLRQELEAEYKRRSPTPSPVPVLPSPEKSPSKRTVKSTNLARITQQLAPKSGSRLKAWKSPLFTKREGPSSVRISDAELRKFDIDPEVFATLPGDLQREQLIVARQNKTSGISNVLGDQKANHPQPPLLKQQGNEKSEKLCFIETEDVIESWMKGFKPYPPNRKDVDYFAKSWVQRADGEWVTDVGEGGVESALVDGDCSGKGANKVNVVEVLRYIRERIVEV